VTLPRAVLGSLLERVYENSAKIPGFLVLYSLIWRGSTPGQTEALYNPEIEVQLRLF
jgi:hypothetical protein